MEKAQKKSKMKMDSNRRSSYDGQSKAFERQQCLTQNSNGATRPSHQIQGFAPDSMQHMISQYSPNEQVSQTNGFALSSQASSGNVQNMQHVLSHQYSVPNSYVNGRQPQLKQPHHSTRVSRALPINQEYHTHLNEMQLLCRMQQQSYNAPVTSGFPAPVPPQSINTHRSSQQTSAIQNVQNQVAFANAPAMARNELAQNSNMHLQPPPSTRVASQMTCEVQNQWPPKFAPGLATQPGQHPQMQHQWQMPQQTQVQSQQPVKPQQQVHIQLPMAVQQLLQLQQQRNAANNSANQQSILSDTQNAFFKGHHQPQGTTPEVSYQTVNGYTTSVAANTTISSYNGTLRPINRVASFDSRETESSLLHLNHTPVLHHVLENGQQIGTSRDSQSKPSPLTMSRIPMQESYSVCDSLGITESVKESSNHSSNPSAHLTVAGSSEVTAKELANDLKNILLTKGQLFLLLRQYQQKYKNAYSLNGKRNVPSSNVQVSNVSPNSCERRANANSGQVLPDIVTNLQSPLAPTSDRMVYQQNLLIQNNTSQEGHYTDQTSMPNIQGLNRPVYSQQVYTDSPLSTTLASYYARNNDEPNPSNHFKSYPRWNLQSEQENYASVSNTQSFQQRKAFSDFNEDSRSDHIYEKTNTKATSNSPYLISNQCASVREPSAGVTELHSDNHKKKQNVSSNTQDSNANAMLPELLHKTSLNSHLAREKNFIPHQNKNTKALSKPMNMPSYHSKATTPESVNNITGSQLEAENVVSPKAESALYQVGSDKRKSMESYFGQWKSFLSANNDQNKQLPSTNVEPKHSSLSRLLCDQNGPLVLIKSQEDVPESKEATISRNDTHQRPEGNVIGYRPETLGSNMTKAVEPQIAVVNPLILSKSKSPCIEQDDVSVKIEVLPLTREGCMSSVSKKDKQTLKLAISTMTNTDHLSSINALLNKLDSRDSKKWDDSEQMAVMDGSSECGSVGEIKTEKSVQATESSEHPLHSENSKLSGADAFLLVDGGYDEELHISNICSLVAGNTFYDSKIAKVFENNPLMQPGGSKTLSEEITVSQTNTQMASAAIKDSRETEVLKDLQDIQCLEDSKAQSGLPHLENTSIIKDESNLLKMCSDTGDKVSVSTSEDTHGIKRTALDTRNKDEETGVRNNKTNDADHPFKQVTDDCSSRKGTPLQEQISLMAERPHEESEGSLGVLTAQYLNSQLFELQRAFPFGIERIETTNLLEENGVISKKELEESDSAVKLDAQRDQEYEISPTQVCQSEKDDSIHQEDLEKLDISKVKMVSEFGNSCNHSSPDICDSEKADSNNQGSENCDPAEVQMKSQTEHDYIIISADICNSVKEDSMNPIPVTLQDSEQINMVFPERSSQCGIATNMSCSQNAKHLTTQTKAKGHLDGSNLQEISLPVPEGIDKNQISSDKKQSCVYVWLPSDYKGRNASSDIPIEAMNNEQSSLNLDDTNQKQGDNTTECSTYSKPVKDVNKLPLQDKGIKQQNSSTPSDDAKWRKANWDTNPRKAESKLVEEKLYQSADQNKSDKCESENEVKEIRLTHQHVTASIPGGTQTKCAYKDNTSKKYSLKEDLSIIRAHPKVNHNSHDKDFSATNPYGGLGKLVGLKKGKRKVARLIVKTDFLKLRCSTSGHLDQNAIEANGEKLHNLKSSNGTENEEEERSGFSSYRSHTMNEQKPPESEGKTQTPGEIQSSNTETVWVRNKHAAESTDQEKETEPQWAIVKASNMSQIRQSENNDVTIVQDEMHRLRIKEYFYRRKVEQQKAGNSTARNHEGTKKNKTNRPMQNTKICIHLKKLKNSGPRESKACSVENMSSDTMARYETVPETLKERPPERPLGRPPGRPPGRPVGRPPGRRPHPGKVKLCVMQQADGFADNESKSKHIIDDNLAKSGKHMSSVNTNVNEKREISVLGNNSKESSKYYLNRVGFQSHSPERIHLTKLELGCSPGKKGGLIKSENVLEHTLVKTTEIPTLHNNAAEPRMSEIKLCPDVLLRCPLADVGSTSGKPLAGKKSSVRGLKTETDDWYNKIPLKKRKIDKWQYLKQMSLCQIQPD